MVIAFMQMQAAGVEPWAIVLGATTTTDRHQTSAITPGPCHKDSILQVVGSLPLSHGLTSSMATFLCLGS